MLSANILQYVIALVTLKGFFIHASAENNANYSVWNVLEIDENDRGDRGWRLPNTTIPLRYHLHVTTQIHREIFEYSGNCTIEISVKESTDELILHAYGLEISEISIEDLTTKTFIPDILHSQVTDLLIIRSSNSNAMPFLRNHSLRVVILYTSVISNGTLGFHILSYNDANNRTVFGAATQFEPILARAVLPCYDEPGFKAIFGVTITHGNNYTAISNMPQKGVSAEGADNMTTTHFMDTPPMSTYLLAFLVSNYANISTESDGTLHRIFMPPNLLVVRDFQMALQNAVIGIKAFGDFIDLSYALPKLDHIILQEHYGEGMENWGLITYTDHVFPNSTDSNVLDRFVLSYTQNHEMVHQWFGDLVTPVWWNHIWLNEGFATYYSYVLTNMLSPDFAAIDAFNQKTCYNFLMMPENLSISRYVEKPKDIESTFGSNSYITAPCIIQMFDHALNQEVFRRGVSNYLKENAYSVVEEDHLYDALQTELQQHFMELNKTWDYSVHEIMKSWTHNRGLPKLTITRNYNDGSITIRQNSAIENSTELWWIPLNFATASQSNFDNTEADFYMPPIAEVTINLSTFNITLRNDDWLIVNKQAFGYYQVEYDIENQRKIEAALLVDHTAIHRLNRINLLLHLGSDWSSSIYDQPPSLDILKYFSIEEDPFVWSMAINTIYAQIYVLNDSKHIDLYKNFMRTIVAPVYKRYSSKSKTSLSMIETFMLEDFNPIMRSIELPDFLWDRKELISQGIANKLNRNEFKPADVCCAAMLFNDEEFEQALDYLAHKGSNAWHELMCTKSDQQYEKLMHYAFEVEANYAESCKSKFGLLWKLILPVYTKDRNLTWMNLDQHLPKFLNNMFTCELDKKNFEDFTRDTQDIPDRYKPMYLKVSQFCEQYQVKKRIAISDMVTLIVDDIDTKPPKTNNNLSTWLEKWLEDMDKENEIS